MRARRALNADDRALLERLMHEVGPRLLAYVRRGFGNRVDAEEIVAETFARAADNVVALARCERQDLYLLTAARNLCRDACRRQRPSLLSENRLSALPGDAGDPGRALSEREDHGALLAAVDRLPDGQREVVVLRLSGELKFEEIAQVLGVPLGTALSRMNAALRRLRKEMGYAHARERA